MNWLIELSSGKWSSDLVIALIHSVWQGVIIAMILGGYLRLTKADASKRYTASLLAMFMLVLCLFATMAIASHLESTVTVSSIISDLRHKSTGPDNKDAVSIANKKINIASNAQAVNTQAIKTSNSATANQPMLSGNTNSITSWKQTVFVCWCSGVILMSARILLLLIGTSRLKGNCQILNDGRVYDIFCDLKKKMNVTHRTIIAISGKVSVPGVIGMIRPVILLPASMVSGISTEDLTAILCHELAHIRRYDWLINIFQIIVESFLFFNPAMWWISRQIRIEREAACDNATIAVTGKTRDYARLLYEWALNNEDSKVCSKLAMGFSGQDKPSGIGDRVKRLVMPGYKPVLRFSLLSIIAAIIVSAVLMFGLWKGTDETVKYFGRLLSPAERIEKMEDIRKEFALSSDDDLAKTVSIAGTVSTIDGKEPENWHLNVVTGHSHISIGHGGGCGQEPKEEDKYKFEVKIKPGRSWIHGSMDGYAPFIMKIELDADEVLTGISVVFDHGFSTKIKVVDESSRPIEGAVIKSGLKIGASTTGRGIEAVSGSDGIALIEHGISHPMSVDIVAEGYQKIDDSILTLEENKTHEFVMRKSIPINGTVVSAVTGEPIAEAGFAITHKQTPGHGWGYGLGSKGITKSDDQGKFVLGTLEDDATYDIVVTAEGYGYAMLVGLRPGQDDLKVELGPPVKIKGKIIGDLSQLSKGRVRVRGKWVEGYKIDANCEYYKGDSMNDWRDTHVTEKDGIGYFEFEKVIGDKITLRSGQSRIFAEIRVIKDKYEYDVTIDLGAEREGRDVVIKLLQPEKYPPANGEVWLSWREFASDNWQSKHVKIVDGVGKVRIKTPCKFSCSTQSNAKITGGYYFDRVNDLELDDAEEPFELEIPLKQAGSIFGKIVDSKGNLQYGYRVDLKVVGRPKNMEHGDISNNALRYDAGENGKFNAIPVPFGGKYLLIAKKDNYLMESGPIKITKKRPIAEYDFVTGRTTDIKGKILQSDGTPAANTEYSLIVSYDYGGGTSGVGGVNGATDENGEFVITDVNGDIDAEYFISLKSRNLSERIKVGSIKKYNTIRLSKTREITGKVIDSDTEKGVPDVKVLISINSHFFSGSGGYTDENGVFTAMVPENANVRAHIELYKLRGRYCRASIPSEGKLDITVTPSNHLTGKVIDADSGEPISGAVIKGYGLSLDSHNRHRATGSYYNAYTDGNGNFAMDNIQYNKYGFDEIIGYEIIGQYEVTFGKLDREKYIDVRVRRRSLR